MNKKDFPTLIKDMRKIFHPQFKAIINADLESEAFNEEFAKIEASQQEILSKEGYTQSEFDDLIKDHFMDFSNEDPEKWIVRYEPENANIITNNSKT